MDKVKFEDRNEELSRKFDVEQYLESSHFIIRFIELRRIKKVMRLINSRNPDMLLDVGCGNAFLLQRINARRAFGIDLSLNNITKAKKRLGGNRLFVLLRANAENLPFEEDRFDTVVCSEVIEHVQNPESVLKEISRVLKQDGTFIITVPNDTLINKWKKFIRITGLEKLLLIQYGGAEEWHIHIFTRKLMSELLSRYGLEIKRTWGFPYFFLPLHYIFQGRKQE